MSLDNLMKRGMISVTAAMLAAAAAAGGGWLPGSHSPRIEAHAVARVVAEHEFAGLTAAETSKGSAALTALAPGGGPAPRAE